MGNTKVEVMANGEGLEAFVIADHSLGLRGPGTRLLVSGAPTFDATVAQEALFEADAVENFDRYNESTVWPAEAAFEFETFAQSRIFARELQRKVPRVGTVRYEFDTMVCYLIDAKLRPITLVEDQGCTLIYRFNISGGLLVDSLPAPDTGNQD